jgi:glycolate oxidase FAD binding subunit
VLAESEAESLWADVRTVAPLRESDSVGTGDAPDAGERPAILGASLWRINVPPAAGAVVTARLQPHGARWFYDWAGGLIWLTIPAAADTALVRSAAEQAGGHAMLVRAADLMRSQVSALHPQVSAVAALTQRIKAAFDPQGVLDPHRFTPRVERA